MKGLSLTQPWASAVPLGLKSFETRSWSTTYRGPLVIHAAKGYPAYAREFALEEYSAGRISEPSNLPRGALICVVELVAVYRTEFIQPYLSELEIRYGDYEPGRFAFQMRFLYSLPQPVPFRGSLGLFEVPDELVVPFEVTP